ncbi:hypothetical protein MBBWO_15440 [Methanobrevibacter woesei]|uniref:Uncharacterized protein n=2 Tax=Methanobrevibacter woesei TaxID=190976 RepID=A0A2U1S5F9_9EURY|nr:hypothetical protein [Methanobrevibacter woesei]PWB84778.1 hypothetical protein MBBWO_15440 [Methanobrevibacter woesei]
MSLLIGHVKGYGEELNMYEVVFMEDLNYEDQKKHVKKLWKEDPKKYYEWKEWCIEWNQLPSFFGTHDNPIDIDESKL